MLCSPNKATFYHQITGGTTYWRCSVPAKHLPAKPAAFFASDVVYGDPPVFPNQEGDTAVWQYPGNTTGAVLMAAMQEANIKVLIEIDDNYLLPAPQVPDWKSEWRWKMVKGEDWFSKEVHKKIVPWVDGVICSTPRLAQAYREGNKNVFVCPNSVDAVDWDDPVKKDDGVLRIGYAASHSHWNDAKLVYRALDWAARQPDVEVWLLGLNPWENHELNNHLHHVPWTHDLAEYRKNLQILDLGVCPLKVSAWHDCKSDVKAMEYGMAGAASIVQRSEPYKPWWDRTWFATDETSWRKIIKHVVKNRDEVKQVAREAKDYILSERTIEKNVWRWEEACAS